MFNLVNLYTLSPLHTGATSQEGNLLGIARESHTNLPYIPSSTIRGRLRSMTDDQKRKEFWGNEIKDVEGGTDNNLTQGNIWVGDGSILWLPVPSLSHGVVWISSPMLLHRWARISGIQSAVPIPYSTNLDSKVVYLKDAILKQEANQLTTWQQWEDFIPSNSATELIQKVMVLPDQHCQTLIQMSLWRQVKIKLDEHKSVDGGFRYEEAIPPDTLMYFSWGTTSSNTNTASKASSDFQALLAKEESAVLQIGGQESLGRGFVQQWMASQAQKQEVAA
mgnify:CR=1 FL=1